MGIYDRPYYGDEDDRTVSPSGQRSIVTNLILLNVAIFLIDMFTPELPSGGHWLSHALALDPGMLTEPWNWWRLLTYGFAHASIDERGIFHVGFNMYGLWLFGRDVEVVRGRREFLMVYLALIVLSGLIWALLEAAAGGTSSLVGASGAVTGIMILFVCHFPDRKFMLLFLPVAIPAWALGGIYVLYDILRAIDDTDSNVAVTCHLAGAALAMAYYRSGIRAERAIPTNLSLRSLRSLRPKPKLRVHDPDAHYGELDRRADRILDKLYREGQGSLTAEERRILEDYSRRMRQKHR